MHKLPSASWLVIARDVALVVMLAFTGGAVLDHATRVHFSQHAEAQSATSHGLHRVATSATGICTGDGTVATPLACSITTDGTSLSGTGSAGSAITYLLTNSDMGAFGDGLDGPCAFDGTTTVVGIAPTGGNTYTLTGDLYCSTVDVDPGITVKTNTWRLFAHTSLINDGVVSSSGNPASGATGGAAITATNGGLTGSCSGGTGGTGVGPQGGAPAAGTPRGWAALGSSGKGGNGVSAGGAARALGAVYTAAQGDIATVQNAIAHRSANNVFIASGGCGATGGSAGGGGGAGTTGGGGGGGAADMVIGAPVFTGSGTFEAKGGNGGNGSNSGTATGGGGGGKGGYMTLIYSRGTAPTGVVTGGTKGTHGSGGGTDGDNGTDGLAVIWMVGAQ